MSQDAEQPNWWELHLRKVRGEALSESEQRRYEEEMARQDREAPLKSDVETLKKVRTTATALAQESAQLRARLYSFKKLMAGVTPENLHGETDTGPAVGREAL